MKEANVIASKNAKRQMRAYLDFNLITLVTPKLELGYSFEGANTRFKSGLTIRIHNFGATPAHNVVLEFTGEVWVDIALDAHNLPYSVNEKEFSEYKEIEVNAVSPNQTIVAVVEFPIIESVRYQMEHEFWSYRCKLKLRYDDAFEDPQSASAAYRSDGLTREFILIPGSKSLS